MAAAAAAVEKVKALWDSQVNDEEAWAFNYVRQSNPIHPSSLAYLQLSFLFFF
jgi:hypothetical protein